MIQNITAKPLRTGRQRKKYTYTYNTRADRLCFLKKTVLRCSPCCHPTNELVFFFVLNVSNDTFLG